MYKKLLWSSALTSEWNVDSFILNVLTLAFWIQSDQLFESFVNKN